MALKDLVAPRAAMTEQAIEEIVADYVRYDPEEKDISFTPAAARLSNKDKILLYLVAIQGWPFVVDDVVPVTAKPAQMEAKLGIPGGSLRPLLKDLRERHLVAARDGEYGVHSAALSGIKVELRREPGPARKPSAELASPPSARLPDVALTPPRRRSRQAVTAVPSDAGGDTRKRATRKSGTVAAKFSQWIADGFFDQPRSMLDVSRQFAREAVTVPNSSIAVYLLRAIRKGQLVREEAQADKKAVWLYRSKK